MNNTVITLSLFFMPIVLLLIGFGIYKHTYSIKYNQSIDIRTKNYSDINVNVTKYIIREVMIHSTGGASRGGYEKSSYHSYIDVQYYVKNETFQSFGKYAEHATIHDALSSYEKLPNRPPLFYQQKSTDKTSTRDMAIEFLSNYKIKPPTNDNDVSIKYCPQNPSLNQLVTKDKRPIGGIFVVYGMGILITLFYFLFSFLAKVGNASYPPVVLCAGLLVLFFIVRLFTIDVSSITREKLPAAAFEFRIDDH